MVTVFFIYLLNFIRWLTDILASDAANKIGGFLSGIGTIILAGVSIYASRSLLLWRKQKEHEERSKLALKILDQLYSFEAGMSDLLGRIYRIHNERPNDRNSKQLEGDLSWLPNYEKTYSQLIDIDLDYIKIYSQLIDKEIYCAIELIEKTIKVVMSNVRIIVRLPQTENVVKDAYDVLKDIHIDDIKRDLAVIRKKLIVYLFFQ